MSETRDSLPVSAKRVVNLRPIKTALHQAVLDERVSQVRILVTKYNVNVDKKDMYGRTPLMLACLVGNRVIGAKMAVLLLRAGALLGVKDNLGRTAMAYACLNGQEKIAGLILKEDMLSLNEADNDGNTPLNYAAITGHMEIARGLVATLSKYGMAIDHRNCLGYTALLLAAKYGHYEIAYDLLTLGEACPTLRDNEFYLNAEEWACRSAGFQAKVIEQRPVTHSGGGFVPPRPQPPLLTRNNTMSSIYLRSMNHTCKHVHVPLLDQTSGGATVDTVRLPVISRGHFHQITGHQSVYDVINAKQKLLEKISEMEDTRMMNEHGSEERAAVRTARQVAPSTAKLMSVSRQNVSSSDKNIADLRTLFKIYAAQYVPPEYRPVKLYKC
ncbi:uncharacterized protein LOC141904262 [Tubulanus polymorphus]|uniref:uncharacterized protein LOC141904262 n=1 Tax=Tubulanus polymorphus TaxID=672921 RepID=UPI003DA3BDE2